MTRRASDQHQPLEILSHSIATLLEGAPKPKTPYDVLDPLLLAIHSATTDVAAAVEVPFVDYPLFAIKSNQLNEFLQLLQRLGLITLKEDPEEQRFVCKLTLKGWDRISELRRAGRSSTQAFVAMSFAPDLDPAWSGGFEPAIKDAGWNPLRMDRLHHNERIDDRIIAEIRRSGLVVADFTGQRAGVYFEAGFAHGLGVPVIWTVRKDELSLVHFDTRQYNHIDWSEPIDLRQRLHERILATVPAPTS
jgi:hypothetical protein